MVFATVAIIGIIVAVVIKSISDYIAYLQEGHENYWNRMRKETEEKRKQWEEKEELYEYAKNYQKHVEATLKRWEETDRIREEEAKKRMEKRYGTKGDKK